MTAESDGKQDTTGYGQQGDPAPVAECDQANTAHSIH